MTDPQGEHDQLSGVPILDVPELLHRLMGDQELAKIVLTGFIDEASETTTELRKSFAGGNFEKVEGLVHTLKGASSNVSAKRLSKLAKAMEDHLKKGGTPGEVSALVDQFPLEMDKLIREALAFTGDES